MKRNIIELKYGNNSFYFEYFGSEKIEDIQFYLKHKYGFIDDEQFGIYQDNFKLPSYQKIIDIENKDTLFIQGNLKSNQKKISFQDDVSDQPSEMNYLGQLRLMGFEESDEKINQLLQKYDNDMLEVITQLLLTQRKLKK